MKQNYLKAGHRSVDPVMLTKDDLPVVLDGWTRRSGMRPATAQEQAQAKEQIEYDKAVRDAVRVMDKLAR